VRRLLVAASLAGALLAPAAGYAAPAWIPAAGLSVAGQNAVQPQIAIDATGRAVAMWLQSDGPDARVKAAVRTGEDWTAAVTLSAAGASAAQPRVVLTPGGGAVALWQRAGVPQSAAMAADGSWGAPVDLSGSGSEYAAIAIGPSGEVLAAWTRWIGSSPRVEAAARAADGTWGAPVALSAGGRHAFDPRVAVDPSGRAVVVWNDTAGSDSYRVRAASRSADGAWGPPEALSADGGNAYMPRVALDASGRALAVWERHDGSGYRAQAATRDADGAWGAPATISGADALYDVHLAAAPSGAAVVLWTVWDGARRIRAASRTADGVWGPAATISEPGGSAVEPVVAIAPSGAATAAWRRPAGGVQVVEVAHRSPEGSWSAPEARSAGARYGAQPAVALDGEGAVAVAWAEGDTFNSMFEWLSDGAIRTATFDAAGPLVGSLTVPATATAGEPVALSASAGDAWSAMGAIAWDLGDGASATGASVTHAYAVPGSYTVTVRAEDALGNATTAVRTITVAAAPPPPPSVPGPPAPTPRARPTPATPGPAISAPGTLRVRDGRVTLGVRCAVACRGRVVLAARGRTLAAGAYAALPGGRARVALALTAAGRSAASRGAAVRALVLVQRREGGRWVVAARRAVVLRGGA